MFEISDLGGTVAEAAKAACQRAGVPEKAIADCTLDVGATGSWKAALSHINPGVFKITKRAGLTER